MHCESWKFLVVQLRFRTCNLNSQSPDIFYVNVQILSWLQCSVQAENCCSWIVNCLCLASWMKICGCGHSFNVKLDGTLQNIQFWSPSFLANENGINLLQKLKHNPSLLGNENRALIFYCLITFINLRGVRKGSRNTVMVKGFWSKYAYGEQILAKIRLRLRDFGQNMVTVKGFWSKYGYG